MENSASVNYIKDSHSHHFKFNCSEIKDLLPEQFVSTPVFYALGDEWVIDCYPRGTRHWSFDEGTSFFVRLHGEYRTVNLKFSLSLMKRDETTSALHHHYNKRNFDSFLTSDRYFKHIIKNYPLGQVFACGGYSNLLFAKDIVNNGSFELICTINNTDIPHNSCSPGVPKASDLHSHIGKLLESSETADATFCIENRSFVCHRLILAARSPVFKAMLFGNMAEATQQQIKIADMCPEVFEAMLHFIYTDSVPTCNSEKTSMKLTQQLFVAADRYALEGLKSLCENKLCDLISLGTVRTTLALALKHSSTRLKIACLDFIAEPRTLINWMLSDKYEDLVRSFPSIKAGIRSKVDTLPSFGNVKK